MAREKKTEPVIQADIGDTYAPEPKLVSGRLIERDFEAGTMSAPPFARVVVATSDDEVPLEAMGKVARFVSLLSKGERVAFFVDGDQIVGVA